MIRAARRGYKQAFLQAAEICKERGEFVEYVRYFVLVRETRGGISSLGLERNLQSIFAECEESSKKSLMFDVGHELALLSNCRVRLKEHDICMEAIRVFDSWSESARTPLASSLSTEKCGLPREDVTDGQRSERTTESPDRAGDGTPPAKHPLQLGAGAVRRPRGGLVAAAPAEAESGAAPAER